MAVIQDTFVVELIPQELPMSCMQGLHSHVLLSPHLLDVMLPYGVEYLINNHCASTSFVANTRVKFWNWKGLVKFGLRILF